MTVPEPALPRGLLVLGYQGTLVPDPGLAHRSPSLWTGHLSLDPWITTAQLQLRRRLSLDFHGCNEVWADSPPLIETLRSRLTGILTQSLLLDPSANEESLLRRFPVLFILLKNAATEWVESIAVFHRRFCRDASHLASWLGLSTLPALAAVTPASSDAHAGGHGVLRLLFCDGTCIYYKPRPVTGEWLWDQLVRAVNAHSSLRLTSAAALPAAGGRYGWVLSLHPHAALRAWDPHSAQSAAWWHAAGATLCLAAHLRITDLHLANVMATACGPAPTDAESLGTPQSIAEASARQTAEPSVAHILDALLETGLLPTHRSADLPDVSGLFGQSAPVPGILVPRWSATPAGACELRFVPAVLMDHANAPTGVSPLQVMHQLVSGYREAAQALLRCRDSLVSPGSPWRSMLEHAHAPRIILRDTLTYGLLLSESLHPQHLRSACHRRIVLLEALRRRSGGALPHAILRAELRDLLALHIPRCTALPGSRTLAAASGRPLARRFFSSSPAQSVLSAIGALSSRQLADVHLPALHLAIIHPHAPRSRAALHPVGSP